VTEINARYGWLVSYPKSGNTWMRMMLHSLRNEGALEDINEIERTGILSLTQNEIDNLRPQLHRALLQEAAAPPDSPPAVFLRKVHDRSWHTPSGDRIFPPELSIGAIYIARDPNDVAISASHHYHVDLAESVRILGDQDRIIARNEKREEFQLPQPLGSWSDHVLSWLDHSGMPVLLVRYEDMLADAARELTRVAQFLKLRNPSKPGAPEFSPDEIAAAVVSAKFENLRAQEDTKGFAERPPQAERFFRKGRSGEGRELLSPQLQQQILADHADVMSRLGYL
jgi:aryl sulfotransferase